MSRNLIPLFITVAFVFIALFFTTKTVLSDEKLDKIIAALMLKPKGVQRVADYKSDAKHHQETLTVKKRIKKLNKSAIAAK